MKILYVVHQFFPNHITGTERLTLNIAKQIQRMGHEVTVLTYEPSENEIDGFVQLDNVIMKKEYQFDSIPIISFKRKQSLSGFYIFDPTLERYLPEIVKKFDIVHFTHPMRFSSAIKACKKFNIPSVLTLTDNWLLCPRGLLTADLKLCDGPEDGRKCMSTCKYSETILSRYKDAKYFFDSVDFVVSGSQFVKWNFEQNGWQRSIAINTFSMDYSFVKEQNLPDTITFAFIGSIIWQKGLHVLIDAFKKIKGNNIKLKIYGNGVDGDFYFKRIKKIMKKDKRIEFGGTFEYGDLPKVMREISVLVIPSVYPEIYPLVMQIGLAYKRPIIASKIGGLPEAVHDGVNGFLFEIGNVEELMKIISNISENPQILHELRNSIKLPPRIEEESLEYENIYRELTDKQVTK
jgi:glycosyltransferase involved in cell wall biosynthesis